MVWAGISLGGGSVLHMFHGGTRTGVKYRNEMFDPRSYAGAIGDGSLLINYNVSLHHTILVYELGENGQNVVPMPPCLMPLRQPNLLNGNGTVHIDIGILGGIGFRAWDRQVPKPRLYHKATKDPSAIFVLLWVTSRSRVHVDGAAIASDARVSSC
ncbi:hypothetical protein AVEN_53660-1 [Araneus ventricosus]|uniref:Uncharacterized protein n=1 Tax=Araneus ventricosus TaxID=182803 RepID=A0A4Y2G194_ARAVE|nr:hypothetical protein AVEN_53660-1 [Araneus ventricosus]